MLSDKKIKQILADGGLVDADDLNKYGIEAEAKGMAIEKYLLDNKIVDEDSIYNALANYQKLPFINIKEKSIPKEVLFLIPEPIASTHEIIAYEKNEKELLTAMTDPEDLETIEFIKRKINLPIRISVTSPSFIKETIKLYHQSLETELSDIKSKTGGKLNATIDDKDREQKPGKVQLKDMAKDLPVIRVVDTLLEYAIFEGASDIHIEPAEKSVIIRYRLDGMLHDVMTLPKELKEGLVARIKILSNLKLDEKRIPQDGRFKIESKDYRISFRVSTIPVFDGEKVVMRLLDEGKKILKLEDLGIERSSLEKVKENLNKPNGMILVTGPTGSGKTTTLYTMMHLLNKPEVNISTIEDPIEYRMPRINQSQVNPKIKFTFANGLRALLRQDPDIIMVGEIRDSETADIAVNAAMTGHLVLSTLHTNDAPTSLPRLLEMGIEPFLVATTTNVIIAQRLVRKLCQYCITSYNLKENEAKQIEKDYGIDFKKITRTLLTVEEVSDKDKDISSILFFRCKGCNKCGGKGYKGRIGIYEVLSMDDEVKSLVTTHATSDAIMKKARELGMITMLEDGFLKAKSGITSIEEVLRVTMQ